MKRPKSNHKHLYEWVLLHFLGPCPPYIRPYSRVKRCTVCGHYRYELFLETVPAPGGYRRILRSEEMPERYKDLPLIELTYEEYVANG
jgi:hypothetical protein